MTSHNDITGDKIQSRPSKIDQSNWESIFGPSSWDKYMVRKKKEEEKKEVSRK